MIEGMMSNSMGSLNNLSFSQISNSNSNSTNNNNSNKANITTAAISTTSSGSTGEDPVLKLAAARSPPSPHFLLIKAAVADGNLTALKKILTSKKLPFHAMDPTNGWSPLFYAIRYKQSEILTWLLAESPQTNSISKDFNGDNALMIACKYKNIQAFNTYLQHCPSAIQIGNKQGDTPIISATKNGLRSLVVSLLDLGCDVNSMDQQGSTLLHHAAAFGHNDIVALLFERGCLYNSKNIHGWTAADYSYSTETRDYILDCIALTSNSDNKRPLMKPSIISIVKPQLGSGIISSSGSGSAVNSPRIVSATGSYHHQ